MLQQLQYQAGQAQVWRDAVTMWFFRTSRIPDEKGRVGNYPGRTEAESMTLDGYSIVPVTPWETASGSKAVECPQDAARPPSITRAPQAGAKSASNTSTKAPASHISASSSTQLIDEWPAADQVPERRTKIDSSSSTRRTVTGIALRKGDEIRIEGIPDGPERAALDYMEIRYIRALVGQAGSLRRLDNPPLPLHPSLPPNL